MSNNLLHVDRRRFLASALPLGTIACLGCTGWAAQAFQPGRKDTFLENPGMSAEEIYSFFYGMFIPVLQSLGRDMGQERFIRTMTKAAEENTAQMIASMAKDLPQRDMKSFSSFLRNVLDSPLYKQAFPAEIVQNTDKVLELRYGACLPAKLLRAMNAADIGYALECSGMAAATRAFNPRITTSNPKNLMKGDSYCVERFVLEG